MRALPSVLFAFVLLAAAPARSPFAQGPPPAKRDVASARLLVPFYEVDLAHPGGASTFFSVRNESTQAEDVTVSYYAADRPHTPLYFETVPLAEKRVLSVDVRSKPNLLPDEDGLARGYVIIATDSGHPVIQGDYFQITPDEDFATGSRLVNIDPGSPDYDLCSEFSIRFLNGGGFDGGTDLFFWLDPDSVPEGETPTIFYQVYNEAGDMRPGQVSFPGIDTAFRVRTADLVSLAPTSFGAMELQLGPPVRGHLAAVMSALGRYSVGLEAACRD